MYQVIELKVNSEHQSHFGNQPMETRVIRKFDSRVAAKSFAHKMNERHVKFFDPRKEIVSFIVKPV